MRKLQRKNEHLRKENESKIPNQTNYGRTKLIKQ